MNQEEMTAKLGLDGTSFDTGIDRATNKAKVFAETTHKSFLHASNGAREFHKALHSVTEASPLLGTALRFAISPIAGMFIGAVTVFKLFHDKLKEINHEFDEMAKLNAKPLFNIQEVLHKAANEMARLNREFGHWLDSHERGDKVITDELEDQLDALHEQAQVNERILKQKKEQGLMSEGEFQKLSKNLSAYNVQADMVALKAAQEKLGSARISSTNEVYETRNEAQNPTRLAEIEKVKEMLKEVAEDIAGGKKFEESHVPKDATDYLTLPFMHESGKSLAESQQAAANAVRTYTKLQKTLNEKLEGLTDAQKTAEEKAKEAQHKDDELGNAQRSVATQLRRHASKLDAINASPVGGVPRQSQGDLATIDELANSGQWMSFHGLGGNRSWFQQGPFAQQAREVQRLENLAHSANLSGNTSLRDQARKEADKLRTQIGATGVLKKEEYEQSMARDMQTLADLATGKSGGMVMRPKMGK